MFDEGYLPPRGMRYGSDFAMKLVYVPVGEDEQPLIYKGRLGADCFDSSSFLKDAEITHGIKLTKKGDIYEGLGEGKYLIEILFLLQ